MPKLLVFAPCERVIEDKDGNNISLISIMQGVSVIVPRDRLPLAVSTVGPQSWYVFAMWQREPDERVGFETKAVLLAPDGKTILETASSNITFNNFSVVSQRVKMLVQGFPMGHPGSCHITLMTKLDGQSEFSEIARFPIVVSQIAREDAES